MSYRLIKDKDEEQAKECLKCGKYFYVGEECPFCAGKVPYCTVCNTMEINNELMFPIEAMAKNILPKKEDLVMIICSKCRKNEIEKKRTEQTMRVLQQTGILSD